MKIVFQLVRLMLVASLLGVFAVGQCYTVKIISSPGTGALALNDKGEIAGFGYLTSGSERAFFWSRLSGSRNLGVLSGDDSSVATGISNSDEVVGWSSNISTAHAFLWTETGGMQDLGSLGGSSAYAYGINDHGEIVGSAALAGDTETHAFLWTATGGMKDLGTLGGNFSYAQAISNTGEVVGASKLADDITTHAFLWTEAGGMQDLGLIGGYVIALGLNDSGTIAGLYGHNEASEQSAFLRTSDGKMFTPGTLGSSPTAALGVGPYNQIVGYSTLNNSISQHAFLWTEADGIRDINDLVPPGFGVVNIASGINRSGQIAATGTQGALLLSPIGK